VSRGVWVGLTFRNAMLDLAPEYFKFTQSTYNKATSLVKIVGFFSVMTHDRKSGVKKNMDLLVMENLFHDHEITKTYDLKGIGELNPLVWLALTKQRVERSQSPLRHPLELPRRKLLARPPYGTVTGSKVSPVVLSCYILVSHVVSGDVTYADL
jgi:hypothetical protein